MNKYGLVFIAAVLTAPALGYERQHNSHEHGVAAMQLVIEGDTLQLKIETPAMNILGFEHKPSTAEQKKTMAQAESLLKNPDNVVLLPKTARCQITEAKIISSLSQNEHEYEHEHEHEHVHDGESDYKGDHDEDSGHADYDLNYQFECDDINALQQINMTIFSHFPLFEELEVQYIVPLETGFGQGIKRVTPAESRFKF